MPTEIKPKDAEVILRFGGGTHSRASEDEIDIRECTDGQNFRLDLQNRNFRPRKPFDYLGTVPNAAEIRGMASLLKTDGTVSMLVQAEDTVYEWDGDTFTSKGSCDSAAKLRGRIDHNWQLDNKVIITDLNLKQPVMEWDGTTLQNITFKSGTGRNLVANGTFDSDTGWTKGTGWTITGTVAHCDGSQTSPSDLTSTDTAFLLVGQKYTITYIVSNYVSGTVSALCGSGGGGTARSANGLYTEELTCTTDTTFSIRAAATFEGDVDSVTVKRVENWPGEFRARYCVIRDERAYYSNIYDVDTAYPHMIVGSKTSDYAQISVSDKPSSAMGEDDPFFMLQPDFRYINGMAEGFGVIATSSRQGALYKLTGSNSQDFSLVSLHRDSGASGDESLMNVGNDIIYGRQGRVESLAGTDRFGDVETDDLSRDIKDQIESFDDWTITYNSRLQIVYCTPANRNQIQALNKSVVGQVGDNNKFVSPWSKWVTNHENNFAITAIMNAYDPLDKLEYVFFGDASGNLFRMEGTGSFGDGGTSPIKVERISKLFTLPLDTTNFKITGWVTYKEIQEVTLNIEMIYQGRSVYTQDIDLSLTTDTQASYYGGNSYYGGTVYYGSKEGLYFRKPIGIAGGSNQFQIKATVESQNEFEINEIGIRFEVSS